MLKRDKQHRIAEKLKIKQENKSILPFICLSKLQFFFLKINQKIFVSLS